MELSIPFFPNTSDDTHCFQAALKMVLRYFLPERTYSWEELERMSAKKENLWTWPTAAVLNLSKTGFEVVMMESFDYERFAERGEIYLIERCGEEVGKAQIEHSDIVQEKSFAAELVKKLPVIKKAPTFDDVERLMSENYVIVCSVNSRILKNKRGYTSHFVVIVGLNHTIITVHDPGLPAFPDREIQRGLFEKAWAYPSPEDKSLIAIRLPVSMDASA